MRVLEWRLPVETTDVIGVFGIRLEYFILILLITGIVLFLLFYFWWQGYKRNQNLLQAKGKVLCEFTDPSGGLPVRRILCEAFKGEIKTIEDKSRALFTTDAYAKAPKGHAIDSYYLLPEHDYLDVYPYGVKPSQQIMVKKFYFQVNDPCPRIPHDSNRWDAERYTRVTSAMAKLAKDESNLQVLVSEFSGLWSQLSEMVAKLKQLPLLLIVSLASIFISFIVGYLAFRSMQMSTAVYKFLVGG